MKNAPTTGFTVPVLRLANSFVRLFSLLFLLFCSQLSGAQAVTEIITDYKGYWKSAAAAPNAAKPDNAHNLLAFSYNGQRYSTGINDGLLRARGDSFLRGDFWSLPVAGLTGTVTSNTKVGLGALYDGVCNGASNPAPEWGINTYLTDGSKGLGLGTCVANLPVGSMSFAIHKIKPAAIGDGVPDILVTQVADPTGNSYDRYEFTDANGNRVGNYKDIVFTNISPVGTWTADFYEAAHNPLTLTGSFTQTDRPLRLWAADLSELGITAANCDDVRSFKINLCGNSDVAFVAYNAQSLYFTQVLPAQYLSFTGTANGGNTVLEWQTAAEKEAGRYMIERSHDGRRFTAVDSLNATNLTPVNNYRFTHRNAAKGRTYYRLKQTGASGETAYSKTIVVDANGTEAPALGLYPNPATGSVYVTHNTAPAGTRLTVRTLSGTVARQQAVAEGAVQTRLHLANLPAGTYFLCFENGTQKAAARLVVGY